MSYTALYRKFRPDNFTDVKGQDHIVTTLTNQIMPICSAGPEEPVRPQWRRSLPKRSTVNIRSMEVPVMNALCVKQSRQELP